MRPELTEEQLAQVVNVNLPLGALLELSNGSDAAGGSPARLDTLRKNRPTIGYKGLYGLYAGNARGYNGEPDGILEVLEEAPEPMTWDQANEWAKSTGGRLPTRKEHALLFANVPELFKQESYWSGEQYAGAAGSAWYQDFYYGYQYDNTKGDKLRARAVRRLPIQ